MATNFLWSGAGAYSLPVGNWLSTELNALAAGSGNVLSVLGGVFQNTGSWLYADVEFVAGGSYTPTAGAYLEVWLLRSLDGGANYEDGSAVIAPGRLADFTISPRAGTTITPRAGISRIDLPPAFYKPLLRNQSGAPLPATGNLIRFSGYSPQY